jgi:low temperature requirement protein LtrA
MAASRAASLLRESGDPERATFLELFFDLVFVFVLTRLSQLAVAHLASRHRIVVEGSVQPLLMLLALLVIWYATTTVTDTYDPRRPEIQFLVVVTMFGTLLMGVAVPYAFDGRGLVFATPYVAIHLGRGLYLLAALRGHSEQRRAIRSLFWYGISAVPWLVGAVAGPGAREALWTIAVVVDYVGLVLGFPTPRLGSQPATESPVVVEHLAERYRQFFIVALGEPIVISGIAYSSRHFEAERTLAFLASFATIVLIWRIYIYRAGELLPAAMADTPDPARLARWTALAHLLMVIGVVAISAGDQLVIGNDRERTSLAWLAVILGGPALFLAGRAVFEYVVSARVSPSRVAGVLTLAGLSPAVTLLPPHVAAIPPVIVLIGIAIADMIRASRHPSVAASPPG